MSRGVNKAILVGNLGNDPEVKYTQGGMAIATLSLATSSTRKDKDGQQVEKTEWHRVKLFGKLGEIAGEYLKKGSLVYVEGSIRYDKFTGTDGVERYFTDIVADEMRMLGGQPGQGEPSETRSHGGGGRGAPSSGARSGGPGGGRATGARGNSRDHTQDNGPGSGYERPPASQAEPFPDDDIPF